jgi:hypothetical protein
LPIRCRCLPIFGAEWPPSRSRDPESALLNSTSSIVPEKSAAQGASLSFRSPGLLLAVVLALAGCAAQAPLTVAQDPTPEAPANCHPEPEPGRLQFVIGYGSLMQDESRQRTAPNADAAHPIEVAGFRRGWFAKGPGVAGTTYLGAVPAPAGRINAVVYRIGPAELAATDRRESGYCRSPVSLAEVSILEDGEFTLAGGQAWIYVNSPGGVAVPAPSHPIVQSYVDIFVSGCLQQEERFHLKGFAKQCVATTSNWSVNWINDRLYPRRPFIHEPRAGQIDRLLAEHLREFVSHIRIE